MEVESDIAKWYQNKAIFITGATGFMGKVLVEKLLRSCPDVGPIYILVREKRKMIPQDRVHDILTSCLFDRLRTTGVNPSDRIIPISGDISVPNLGISNEDSRLLQDTVSVVFHVAATVKFNEPLRVAMAVNFEATKELMALCRGMTSLRAVVYVSTAYSNCILPIIEECVYPPPMDLDKVAHCLAGMDDRILDFVTPRLLGNHPNTYTFTKALAENLVAGYSTELPIVVVRPSVVLASWREPIPGWIDNMQGPTGLFVGAGKGLLRDVYGGGELKIDLIPVDICINLIIASAWEMGSRDNTKLVGSVRVYNCVSRPFKSLSYTEFLCIIDSCLKKYALSECLTNPSIRMTASRMSQTLNNIPEQAILATLADIYLWFIGGQPRFQYRRHKVKKMTALLEFFTTHDFEFKVDNVERLKHCLTPVDQDVFNFDITNINWEEYLTRYFLGIRRHALKEKDQAIHRSRQWVASWTLMKKAIRIGAIVILVISYFYIYSFSHLEESSSLF